MSIIYLTDGNEMEVLNCFDELCKEYGANFDKDSEVSDDIFDESSWKNDFDLQEFMKTDPMLSVRQTKKLKKTENLKTLKNWYDLPRQEITEDVKIFSTRNAWDTKRFYKGDDRSKQTEYFQRGVIENSVFTPSTAVSKQCMNADILDNLLESDALKKKLKKTEQKRRFEENQRVLAKRTLNKIKSKKAEKASEEKTKKKNMKPKRKNKSK